MDTEIRCFAKSFTKILRQENTEKNTKMTRFREKKD